MNFWGSNHRNKKNRAAVADALKHKVGTIVFINAEGESEIVDVPSNPDTDKADADDTIQSVDSLKNPETVLDETIPMQITGVHKGHASAGDL